MHDITNEYLTTKQYAELTHQSVRTCERQRMEDTGPKFIRLGRKVLYLRKDIDDWLESRKFENTAEAKAAEVRS